MCFCGQVPTFSTAMHIVIHMFRSMNMLEEIKAKWDEILLNIKEEHDISEEMCIRDSFTGCIRRDQIFQCFLGKFKIDLLII